MRSRSRYLNISCKNYSFTMQPPDFTPIRLCLDHESRGVMACSPCLTAPSIRFCSLTHRFPPRFRLPHLAVLVPLRFASFAIINIRRNLHPQECTHAKRKKKAPFIRTGLFIRCLAVTYFRMRKHTIIGATSFHDPVRDGKGWVQSAMTAKRNFNDKRRKPMTTSPGRLSQVNDLEEVNLDYFVSLQTTYLHEYMHE